MQLSPRTPYPPQHLNDTKPIGQLETRCHSFPLTNMSRIEDFSNTLVPREAHLATPFKQPPYMKPRFVEPAALQHPGLPFDDPTSTNTDMPCIHG